MGFYSFWTVTGSIASKAESFGVKVIRPILNGITSIADVVKETAGILSMAPVIGAVASQIGAAANIMASVSSAGAEIIGVGERFVAKHAAPEPVVSMQPPFLSENQTTSWPNVSAGINVQPPTLSQAPTVFHALPVSSFPAAAPLPAAILPKNTSYPERRILRVRRPSARERTQIYAKESVDDLAVCFEFLNIGSNVPRTMKTGNHPWGLFRDGAGHILP